MGRRPNPVAELPQGLGAATTSASRRSTTGSRDAGGVPARMLSSSAPTVRRCGRTSHEMRRPGRGAFARGAFREMLDASHKWTGRVNYFRRSLFQIILNLRCHSMSTNDSDGIAHVQLASGV